MPLGLGPFQSNVSHAFRSPPTILVPTSVRSWGAAHSSSVPQSSRLFSSFTWSEHSIRDSSLALKILQAGLYAERTLIFRSLIFVDAPTKLSSWVSTQGHGDDSSSS